MIAAKRTVRMVFEVLDSRLLRFEPGACSLLGYSKVLVQLRRFFRPTPRAGRCFLTVFLPGPQISSTTDHILILVTSQHPPLRATPHRRVLPVTLLTDETALLLGETDEFLILLALLEQLPSLAIQPLDLSFKIFDLFIRS